MGQGITLSARNNPWIYALFAVCAVLAIVAQSHGWRAMNSGWRWTAIPHETDGDDRYAVVSRPLLNSRPGVWRLWDGDCHRAYLCGGRRFLSRCCQATIFSPASSAFLTHCAHIWALTRDSRFAADKSIFALFAVIGFLVIAGLWSFLAGRRCASPLSSMRWRGGDGQHRRFPRDRQVVNRSACRNPPRDQRRLGGNCSSWSATRCSLTVGSRWNIPYNAVWVLGTIMPHNGSSPVRPKAKRMHDSHPPQLQQWLLSVCARPGSINAQSYEQRRDDLKRLRRLFRQRTPR